MGPDLVKSDAMTREIVGSVETTPEYDRREVVDAANHGLRVWRRKFYPIERKLLFRRPLSLPESMELHRARVTEAAMPVGHPDEDPYIPSYGYEGDGRKPVTFGPNKEYTVLEGIPIDGAIDALSRDIAKDEENLSEALKRGDRDSVERNRRYVAEDRKSLQILMTTSIPYREAHPKMTDEQYQARIRHEGEQWRQEGTIEPNWYDNASKVMEARRELIIPAKVARVEPAVSVVEPISEPVGVITPVVEEPSPVAAPELATVGTVGDLVAETGSGSSREIPDYPTGFLATLRDLARDVATDMYKSGRSDLESLGREVSTRIGWAITDIRWKMTEHSMPRDGRKIERLMRLGMPEAHRRDLRLLILPVVLALLVTIPRDTIPQVYGQEAINPGTPAGLVDTSVPNAPAMPEFVGPKTPMLPSQEGQAPAPQATLTSVPTMTPESTVTPGIITGSSDMADRVKDWPKEWQDFRLGAGLDTTKYIWADYRRRSDWEDRLQFNNPNRDIGKIPGYSLKGLAEEEFARFMNEQFARQVADLTIKNKALPEDDARLLQTLILVEQKIDRDYGPGTYKHMIDDLSVRMQVTTDKLNPDSRSAPAVGDKILIPRFRMEPIDEELVGKLFELEGERLGGDPNGWRTIRDEINREMNGGETSVGVDRPPRGMRNE